MMKLQLLDWAIVVVMTAIVTIMALRTRRYSRSVADFLAANRCAGRYLLAVAEGGAASSAIVAVAAFEMYYNSGFSPVWWSFMLYPIGLIIALSGWVVYRFRETRALTLAQFFEVRYSRRFRIFTGILAFVSGIVNFGVFPAIAARFVIYFAGLPPMFTLGGLSISTYLVVMVLLVGAALYFTLIGGQIAIIVTDFVQGLFCNVAFIVLLIAVFVLIGWSEIMVALQPGGVHAPLLHPFHTSASKDFNASFFLIAILGSFYSTMAWQGMQGYNASARSAHEAKMSGVIGRWRQIAQTLLWLMLPIAAYTVLHHPAHATMAARITNDLNEIQHPQIRTQMTTPIALAFLLPVGLRGMLLAALIAGFIATVNSYLHSWGSIFIQDVILPFRRAPLSSRQHLRLLRWSIAGVAVFIVSFSLIFQINDYILMFFAITSAIYLGGAGSAIIGGLYWKHGTTAGAWVAMSIGSVLAVGGMAVRAIHPAFPMNGQTMWLVAMLSSAASYVVVSLLGKHRAFDLNRMLHRAEDTAPRDHPTFRQRLLVVLGVDRQFTRGDKVIFGLTILWSMAWFGVFVIGTTWSLIGNTSIGAWATFWKINVGLSLLITVVVTVWLAVGGVRDLVDMFAMLRDTLRDHRDDGTVVAGRNAEEVPVGDAQESPVLETTRPA